ncbi:MAG: GNAT family N-acetyltransferase [Anaerolineae bacterium]|nr:GNAT family N-acetyltransferase [Anaerolineae bacterium]
MKPRRQVSVGNVPEPTPGLLPRVREATPADAQELYSLIAHVFRDTYLAYTVYQAPKAVHYLAQLIAEGPERTNQHLTLVEHAGRIIGYTHAIRRDQQFFLNYLAVAGHVRRQGIGSTLLRNYEERALCLGCDELVLDVFSSNVQAHAWYQRRGYQLQSSGFRARLALDLIPRTGCPLQYDEESWTKAQREEEAQGFSRVECVCGSGRLILGLIANRACRLLAYTGITLEEAVLAVAKHMRGERDALILPSLPAAPTEWPLLGCEKVLRLSKPVGCGL